MHSFPLLNISLIFCSFILQCANYDCSDYCNRMYHIQYVRTTTLLVVPDLKPSCTNYRITRPYFYLDILPYNDRSLGRDCTLLIAMATRAKYTSLNYLTCSPPYFFSFCLIPIFFVPSLPLLSLPSFSTISPVPNINHNFRTFERCGCPPA